MPDHSGPTADATGQSGGPPQTRRRGPLIFAWGVVIVVAGLVGYGAWGQAQRRTAALETLRQQENMVPHVRTAAVKVTDAPRMLNLPGNIEAFDSAIIYARATGYIAKRNVDIGSKVHAGDVLAVIAAPDLDQQLAQARAQLVQMQAAIGQAHANMELAQRTNARTVQMVQQGWQSKQQGDTDRFTYVAQDAALKVAEANYKAQKAEVSRLEKLTGFEKVVAPFNGVISQRQIDVGSLVTANVSSGTALFSIVRSDVLRIQVYVPQDTALDIKDGQSAEVRVPEMPNRVFHGTVARNATALQPGTRTLLTEVDVNNSNETLLPGLYCTVQLAVPRRHPVITVPSQAVIFNKDGLSAAVDEDGMVRLRHLDVLADDGAEVEVRAGLNPTDRIILNPPIGVTDGMHVSSTNTPEEARAE
ncbi:efflux RND transporter periplasmic adaptor subunit [Methylovirgula sp. HY1]|uniref:efflux RND transporter periplasmic adaptor subunit n=1 Tax=Methylovirgula sp. HY1 TaxID=2822761 RepID=UPI001C5AB3F2|nr:efflux RND transporter periplasmic adaptor subunit [Methylovirgula sp. HY1]QXX74193.1 Multidrug resistance protein MdtA [Methylovirgula sp. HY1]